MRLTAHEHQAAPDAELAEAVLQLLHELCTAHGIHPAPRLEWSKRMRRMLGTAYPKKSLIRLSAWLDPAQAEETLRHELAHIAADSSRRSPSHGQRWREWAMVLGARPRAAAPAPPALAPPRITPAMAWGLECAACGVRFVRQRTLRGLYHRDCGPRMGRLRKVIRDNRDHVVTWARERGSEGAGKQGR